MRLSKTGNSESQARDRAVVVVPRLWLIALTALIILPWLASWIFGLPPLLESPVVRRVSASSPAAAGATGPWGSLLVSPIVVSPPLEYVSTDVMFDQRVAWHFAGASAAEVERYLTSIGLASDAAAAVARTARAEPKIKGVVVTPDVGLVRSLSPEVREQLYMYLAKVPQNYNQDQALRYHASSADAWLGASSISPQTRQLVYPLLYGSGDYLYLADLELLRPQIGDPAEFRRLVKALHRQATSVVTLSIQDAKTIDALTEYWGRGGRRTDIRPLLESVAGSGRSIDIVHLLPTFARTRLYRYPRVSTADFDRPVLVNCLWSSLNFFNSEPDDRFLNVQTALETLKRNYFVVEDDFQLGDIVAMLDQDGDLFHVASYLADGLVFSKNGMSTLAPWAILSIEALKGYYRTREDKPRLIVHRRNDF